MTPHENSTGPSNPATSRVACSAWFGGGRVPKTPGWTTVRTGKPNCRKWVNWSAGCWVTLWRGEQGVHLGYAQVFQGYRNGMTAAQAVAYLTKQYCEQIEKN